jgi:hypothetical protein
MFEKRRLQMQNLHRLKGAFTTILTHRSGLLQFVNIAPHVADVAEDIIAAVDWNKNERLIDFPKLEVEGKRHEENYG